MIMQNSVMQFQARLKDIANWKPAKPKTYHNWICKPTLGTRVQCPFTGRFHITSQDKPFLVSGTRGELSTASIQHIALYYVLANNKPITSAYIKTKCDAQGNIGWIKVRYNLETLSQDERSYRAIQCPNLFQNIAGVVNETLNDTAIPQHGNGDFVVVAVNEATQQVVSQAHLVNGLVFGDIFDMRNWAGALPKDFQPISEPPMPRVVHHKSSDSALLKKLPALIYQSDEIRAKCNNISVGESSYQLDLKSSHSKTVPVFSVRLLRGQSWDEGTTTILDFSIGPLGSDILCFRHREVIKQGGDITHKAISDWASVEAFLHTSAEAINEGNIYNIFIQLTTLTANPVVADADKCKSLAKIVPSMIKDCYHVTSRYSTAELQETSYPQMSVKEPATEYSVILVQDDDKANRIVDRLHFRTEGVAEVKVLFRYTCRQWVLGKMVADLESEWVPLENYLHQAVTSILPKDIPSIFDKLINTPHIKASNTPVGDRLALVSNALHLAGLQQLPAKGIIIDTMLDTEHKFIFDKLKGTESTIRCFGNQDRQIAILLSATSDNKILASCIKGTITSQWVCLGKFLKTVIRPDIATADFGAFVIQKLTAFAEAVSPYFAPTHKKDNYTISVCKMPVGVTFYNPFEDATYTTTEDKRIVLKGTRDEMWTIRKDRLSETYELISQQPVTDDILTESWLHVKPKSGLSAPTVYAIRIPECTSFQVEAWGSTLTCNRPGVPHRGGDMLMCGEKDGKPDLDKFWFVNGEIFHSTYKELPPVDKLRALFK